MKKTISCLILALLCAALLCGCSMLTSDPDQVKDLPSCCE